jgi:hypothetical protein
VDLHGWDLASDGISVAGAPVKDVVELDSFSPALPRSKCKCKCKGKGKGNGMDKGNGFLAE